MGLSRKQRVLLSWTKQVHTGEREIYFFNKSGDMFVLKLFLQNSSSSGKAKFECKCEMEVGEHEGSLNISDSGVYEVLPFSIQRAEGKQQPVVLKTVGTEAPKAGYNLGEILHKYTDRMIYLLFLPSQRETSLLLTRTLRLEQTNRHRKIW